MQEAVANSGGDDTIDEGKLDDLIWGLLEDH